MPILRYYDKNNRLFPKTVLSIVQRLIIWISQTLYTEEASDNLMNTIRSRTIISDIGAGEDVQLGDASEFFGSVNVEFPFTSYGAPEREVWLERNLLSVTGGSTYISGMGYASLFPTEFTLPMVSFFSNADDWNRAYTLLSEKQAKLERLEVPIVINGIECSFKIDIKYEQFGNGQYAGRFEDYLRTNNIWDLVHSLRIQYNEMRFSGIDPEDADNPFNNIGDYEAWMDGIDGMTIRLINGSTGEILTQLQQPPFPKIDSITPADTTENVTIDSPVVINFNQGMVPDSVEDAFSITPFVEGDLTWDEPAQVLTFTPRADLDNLTTYIISIANTAKNAWNQTLEGNDLYKTAYSFSFTTV